MAAHELKIWPEYFKAVVEGRKTFELRKTDRPFAVGDTLNLREWDPVSESYTGQSASVIVTYLLRGGRFELPGDLVVLGIQPPASAGLLLESKRNLSQKLARLVARIDRARLTAEKYGFSSMAHDLQVILDDPEVTRG